MGYLFLKNYLLYVFFLFSPRSMWAQLQDQIKIRTKRLASAAEIHRFNRDLNELITRIQEKDASLSMEDLGRDMASVQGLQRKHEGHERDLLAVQQQVETLSAESAKLQAAYQGTNGSTLIYCCSVTDLVVVFQLLIVCLGRTIVSGLHTTTSWKMVGENRGEFYLSSTVCQHVVV